MDKEYEYISYCGKYYCAACDYHKGTITKAAKNLLAFAEKYGSLRVMADIYNTCNFEEFLKGLLGNPHKLIPMPPKVIA